MLIELPNTGVCYKPAPTKPVLDPQDGSARQWFDIVPIGRVEVFSYPGDDRSRAFTSVSMEAWGLCFRRTFRRHYNPRWFGRLARSFARDCQRCKAAALRSVRH